MHPILLADIAVQRQMELLQEAENRRLRVASRRRTQSDDRVSVSGPSRWRRTLMAMFRPAPEPCCA